MRLPVFLLTLLALLPAPGAQAEAWSRGKGRVFSAAASHYRITRQPFAPLITTSIMTEYGLSDRATLALELDLSDGRFERGLAFYRVSLLPPSKRLALSFAIGAGSTLQDPVIASRLSVGYGFEMLRMNGWAEAVAGFEMNYATGAKAAKLDLTLGLSAAPQVKSYVQLFLFQPIGGVRNIRFQSSVALRLHRNIWLDAGLSTGITPIFDRRIKAGIWTQF